MRFSRYFKVTPRREDDWFDIDLESDTALAVDPFRIYDETEGPWVPSHDRVLDFFGMIFGLIRDSGGNRESLAWKKAANMLLFPEPAEFCLGVSTGSPLGNGSGPRLQECMLAGVETAIRVDMDTLEHMEALALFTGGFGLDRMSDTICNILKSEFIAYTQEVCRRHGIPMEKFRVPKASWSEDGRWQDRDVELPLNPFVKRRRRRSGPQVPVRLPILLVPERFLRDIPVATSEGFWDFAEINYAETLRTNFNYDVSKAVTKEIRARLARQNPTIVEDYLRSLEGREHPPYDVFEDPKKIVRARDLQRQEASLPPLRVKPASVDDFDAFVREIIEAYRHSLEDSDGWTLLWYKDEPREEKAVQAAFRMVAQHYCKAAHVYMVGEANAGLGPVDFVFSKGWEARALVEMKLMASSHLWDGVLAQVPTYARAEEIKSAFYVAVAMSDSDLSAEKIEKVRQAAALASERNSIKIEPVVIDARPKQSASKIKPSAEDRAALRRRGEGARPAAA